MTINHDDWMRMQKEIDDGIWIMRVEALNLGITGVLAQCGTSRCCANG